ncbi:MAG: TonB-dependent receptor, partial [Pseudomonadota bacterium]
MSRKILLKAGLTVVASALLLPNISSAQELEEIVVTARQVEETLQDVPVTVAVMSEEDLDRYNITNLVDAAKLVPNFQINLGGSGNGSNLFLRGVGSSSISAAFDQSVAINVDGVVVNIGRFIHNSYMDMGQLEVLKGPQSLYFGKSATAGVVSITTNDPDEEFEAMASVGYETEHEQTLFEGVISGPITDTFGARLALGKTKADELYRNLNPNAQNQWRGDESLNARLTLTWNPSDTVDVRFKYAYSEYENDGPTGNTEEFCPEGSVQPTVALGNSVAIPGLDDCILNGNTSTADLLEPLRIGLPGRGASGVPYLEQETSFTSLEIGWDINPQFSLTSVTGYVDLEHQDLDIYDYNVGIFGGQHFNTYKSFSQELRLSSALEGPVNFQFGVYYQDVSQDFLAFQFAANIGLVVPDPVTGNGYDYNKNHFLDTEVFSTYLAGYWDISETLELTGGLRYTKEDKSGFITIPYVHTFLQGSFAAPPLIDGLDFDDSNVSPEIAINWYLNDEISVFAAYKEGFKSGGVDNSALPTASLSANNPDFPNFLIYQSEEAKGFEVGLKARLLAGAMRFNATAFSYTYSDLQTQLFDSEAIQF